MQRLRDNPECADEERAGARRFDAPGLRPKLTFDPAEDIAAPYIATGVRPKVAILREQGVNSQVETAVAFDRAGFDAFDVHMSDLIAGRARLEDFAGFVACGGFSYGDVLGAGRGWATSILERTELRDAFAAFFARGDTFALGVCNGCQMLAQLKPIIPGARTLADVPAQPQRAVRGAAGDAGSDRVAVAVPARHGRFAHSGRGRARRRPRRVRRARRTQAAARVALRYVDGDGTPATRYPANPNGSPDAHRRPHQPTTAASPS